MSTDNVTSPAPRNYCDCGCVKELRHGRWVAAEGSGPCAYAAPLTCEKCGDANDTVCPREWSMLICSACEALEMSRRRRYWAGTGEYAPTAA